MTSVIIVDIHNEYFRNNIRDRCNKINIYIIMLVLVGRISALRKVF
jgi:hypothetical protein